MTDRGVHRLTACKAITLTCEEPTYELAEKDVWIAFLIFETGLHSRDHDGSPPCRSRVNAK